MAVRGDDGLSDRPSAPPPPPVPIYPEAEAGCHGERDEQGDVPPPVASTGPEEPQRGEAELHLGPGDRFYVYRPPWRRPRVILLVVVGAALFVLPLRVGGLWWLTLAVSLAAIGLLAVLGSPAHRPQAAVAALVVALLAFVGLEAYNDVAFGTLSLNGPPPLIFACGAEYPAVRPGPGHRRRAGPSPGRHHPVRDGVARQRPLRRARLGLGLRLRRIRTGHPLSGRPLRRTIGLLPALTWAGASPVARRDIVASSMTPPPPSPAGESPRLRVANFNVHAGVDGWGRPFDVLAACVALDADVLVLEEVWRPEGEKGMAAEVAEGLGYFCFEHPLADGRRAGPHPDAGTAVDAAARLARRQPCHLPRLEPATLPARDVVSLASWRRRRGAGGWPC